MFLTRKTLSQGQNMREISILDTIDRAGLQGECREPKPAGTGLAAEFGATALGCAISMLTHLIIDNLA